jgi:hypothetical protein
MHMPIPLANQLGAGLQRDGNGSRPTPLFRGFRKWPQTSLDAKAQPALGMFLNPVGDPADQQIAAQPGRRRHAVQPVSFGAKIGGRQRFERNVLGLDIGTRPTEREISTTGRPAGFPASFLGLANRHHARASAIR